METGYYQMVLFEVEVAGIKMKPAPLSCHVNLHNTYLLVTRQYGATSYGVNMRMVG